MRRNRISRGKGCARQSTWGIRILLVDREPVFRLGLKSLMASEDDLCVVAQADSAAGALSNAKIFRPNLVLIQEEILSDSEDLISALLQVAPKCRVISIVSSSTEDFPRRPGNAAGIVPRTGEPQLFITCARRVATGETCFPGVEEGTLNKPPQAGPDHAQRPVDLLTTQEKTVISCLMQGWPNREIASHLSIGQQTVKNHLYSIFNKTGVSDRLELFLYIAHQPLRLPPVKFPALPYDHLSEVQDDLL
jgi:DNA-binding NarL/FixJ family response regulator